MPYPGTPGIHGGNGNGNGVGVGSGPNSPGLFDGVFDTTHGRSATTYTPASQAYSVDVRTASSRPLPGAAAQSQPLPKYVAVAPRFLEPSPHGGSDLSKKLYWTCVKGDVVGVQALLRQKANVNYADRVAGTPLHGACRHNQLEVAQLLISSRAEVNAMPLVTSDEFSQHDSSMSLPLQTPLYYACRDNNERLIDFLLARKAAIDFVNKQRGLVDSPLNCAHQYGHIQLFRDLEELIGTVAKPTIREQPPEQQIVLEGQSLVIRVAAVAADYPLQYQWYHNDQALPGEDRPELRVDVVHKLTHKGSYCCFVRAMYSKLTGAVDFPPALVGGQPIPGTAGTNDTVSDACLVQVESMVERLTRLRFQVAGQQQAMVHKRERRQEVRADLDKVEAELRELRPAVEQIRAQRANAKNQLRVDLQRFLRLKQSCLDQMDEAGQTVGRLAQFDVNSDLDRAVQQIIDDEKAGVGAGGLGGSLRSDGFLDQDFTRKIEPLAGRVEELEAGTSDAVSRYHAARTAWQDAYSTFRRLREEASAFSTLNEAVRDYAALEDRRRELRDQLEALDREMVLTTTELQRNEDEQRTIKRKYDDMRSLVHNAFQPLYDGDDNAAVDAIQRLLRQPDLKLTVAIVLCQIAAYLARKPANARAFNHRVGLVKLLQDCGVRFGDMFAIHKNAVVALLLGRERKGRQYSESEWSVFSQLRQIAEARDAYDVHQLMAFLRTHRFYFEGRGGSRDDDHSARGAPASGIGSVFNRQRWASANGNGNGNGNGYSNGDRGGAGNGWHGVDSSSSFSSSSSSSNGYGGGAAQLTVKQRRLITTTTLEALQKVVSSNPYAALAFVRLRGNVLLQELYEAEFGIFTAGSGTAQQQEQQQRQQQRGTYTQSGLERYRESVEHRTADHENKHVRGRIDFILDVARTVHSLWTSGHTSSIWTTHSAVSSIPGGDGGGGGGAGAANKATTARSTADVLENVINTVNSFRGVALGRFEAFHTGDLSVWFNKNKRRGGSAAAAAAGDNVNPDAQQKPLSFAMVLSVAQAFCHCVRRDHMVRRLVVEHESHVAKVHHFLKEVYNQVLEFHECDKLPPAFQPWYQNKPAAARLLAKLLQTIDMLQLAFFFHFSAVHATSLSSMSMSAVGDHVGIALLLDLIDFGVGSGSAIAALDVPRLAGIMRSRNPTATTQQARAVLQRLQYNLRKYGAFLEGLRDDAGNADLRKGLSSVEAEKAARTPLTLPPPPATIAAGSDARQTDDIAQPMHLLDGDAKLVVWLHRRGLASRAVKEALVQHDVIELANLVVRAGAVVAGCCCAACGDLAASKLNCWLALDVPPVLVVALIVRVSCVLCVLLCWHHLVRSCSSLVSPLTNGVSSILCALLNGGRACARATDGRRCVIPTRGWTS